MLVSDDTVSSIVTSRLARSDAQHGFLLDGFPRTFSQAFARDQTLGKDGLAAVIELQVSEEALYSRICRRAVINDNRGRIKPRRLRSLISISNDPHSSKLMACKHPKW